MTHPFFRFFGASVFSPIQIKYQEYLSHKMSIDKQLFLGQITQEQHDGFIDNLLKILEREK